MKTKFNQLAKTKILGEGGEKFYEHMKKAALSSPAIRREIVRFANSEFTLPSGTTLNNTIFFK